MRKIPHPIPYQGSKRSLAPIIGNYVPSNIDVWFEPFAGSAAMSLWLMAHNPPQKIVLGDSLEALTELWRGIIMRPEVVASQYRRLWSGQLNADAGYFNYFRSRFNVSRDPVELLYLMC